MKEQTVLILGAGVGGIVAASALRKNLARQHRVILVDKKADLHFTPSYLWIVTGSRTIAQISRPLAPLSRKGIEFFQEEVQRIDSENKVVQTDKKEVPYDYLIIALGADLSPESVPGYSPQAVYNLYNLDTLSEVRKRLLGIESGSLVILIASPPFKCPAAPYETALLADYILRNRGIRDKISVSIFTPEPLPMPTAGPALGNAVKQLVEARGIKFNPGHKVAEISSSEQIISFENQAKVSFDLLLMVPPHKVPQALTGSGLSGETGWVPVDRQTLSTFHENVYAIGDVATIMLPNGMMLPKAGVFAEGEALVVAENIAAELSGRKERRGFTGEGSCFLETGYGKAGYASGNFFAEPAPEVDLKKPSRYWHWGKVLFEKYWLRKWL